MSVSGTYRIPVIHGCVQEMGNNTKVLLAKNYQNEILFRGEIIKSPTKDQLKECRKIFIINEDQTVEAYLKIKTVIAENESFKFLQKEITDESFCKVMSYQGTDKIVGLMQNNMKISFKSYQGKEKVRENIQISRFQIFKIVSQIESKKSEWIKEANEKGHWIKKTIDLADNQRGSIKVIVDIFPDTRAKKDKLGQIDIRMAYIGNGSFKNVYESYNYQTSKITAGLYAKNQPTILQGIAIEEYVARELSKNENRSLKKLFVISKAIDKRPVEKANDKYQRIKFTQRLFSRGDFLDLLINKCTKKGEVFPVRQVYTDMLKGLQFLEKIGVVHRDIKPENLLIDSQGVRISDWDLGVKGQDGKLCGTLRYAAPELFTGQPADKRSDLYSLGKSMCPQLDPWLSENSVDDELLKEYRDMEVAVYDQPKTNTLKHFQWKMTHQDENRRFQNATEALAVLEALPDTKETDFERALWLEDENDDDIPALEEIPALENIEGLSEGVKGLAISENVVGSQVKRTLDSKTLEDSDSGDIYQAKRARDTAS